jgi:hypothetical protein
LQVPPQPPKGQKEQKKKEETSDTAATIKEENSRIAILTMALGSKRVNTTQ